MKVETLLAVIRFWLLLILIVMIVLLAVMKRKQNDSSADTGSDRSQVIKIQQKYTTPLMYSTTNDEITTVTTEETVTNYVDKTFCDVTKVGDGICQDEVNIPQCAFDAGDCCQQNTGLSCQNCTCYPTAVYPVPMFCPDYIIPMIGDFICDDMANTIACNFDGGDCCYDRENENSIATFFCYICVCTWEETNFPLLKEEEIMCMIDNSLYLGDGLCDDAFNNPECEFDGGDCCLSSINRTYCLFCTCYANNNVESCKLSYAFVGNGVCEDIVNTEVCDYDGGDCCLDEIIGGPYACEFGCICHLDGTKHPHAEFCSDMSDIADGYCHDMSNTPVCEFDGGDCCLADMKVNFCVRCTCVNDMNYTTTEISRFTGYDIVCHIEWMVGDGYCDDDANKLPCNYDGGDCCYNVIDINCVYCQCKDLYTGYPVIPYTTIAPYIGCAESNLIGNGICDYNYFNEECFYDGGDCQDECGSDLSIGDGFCDEESNNANCGFDGGDCCSDTTQLTCKYCTCKEPGGPF